MQEEHRRIDRIILEKMIYAFHLLEQLKINGLDFVFKGGTSLVLLLEEESRFSIDIDIVCSTPRADLEVILNKVIESSRFTRWKLDEHRSYKPGIPKAHYRFSFDSSRHGSGAILLDILREDTYYPELCEIPIATKWIETEGNIKVTVPTIDSITGDKLTAFAPATIGIPFFKGSVRKSFTMDICKQIFDLGRLFERIGNVEKVAISFKKIAEREIEYRQGEERFRDLTPEMVLNDTIRICTVLAKRGRGTNDDKIYFRELQKGIVAFGSSYLMSGTFRIDDAIQAAARIAYLSARIFSGDHSPIEGYGNRDLSDWKIEHPEWNFLNPLKRQPDRSAYYYWYRTVELISDI